ncbi:hypothetical protein FQN50_001313 [Emmonsiellopsis sp. PD_5]|nr:hypothetical protein FQN50_001313 [Emmonsiellopsis sp. PD_5]
MPLTKPARILWRRQKSLEQTQSVLFKRLPLELREIIYELVFHSPDKPAATYRAPSDFHIFSHSGKLVSRRCSSAVGPCSYTEAIPLLYSQNTFIFKNLTTITLFTSTIPPQRMHCIRSIRLEWIFSEVEIDYPYGTGAAYSTLVDKEFDRRWKPLWSTLAGMSGLQTLHVRLIRGTSSQIPIWEDRIFEAMRQVGGLERFEVEVNWGVKESSVVGPFQVTLVREKREDNMGGID